ncbi:MAG: hypothetical protein V4710_20470 [Verrucomicrobiota bacterium]
MRTQLLVTLSIVIASLAFAAGVLVQSQHDLATIRTIEAFRRDLSRPNAPIYPHPPPPWEAWHYPNAKVEGTIHGSSVRINGDSTHPAREYAVLITADEFDQVAHFYAEKTGFANLDEVAKSHSAISIEESEDGSDYFLEEDNLGGGSQALRSVRTKCLARRFPPHGLTVFITRANDHSDTHIVLLYDPEDRPPEALP